MGFFMDFFASEEELRQIEGQLPSSTGVQKLKLLVALAWHQRQSDCAQALSLTEQAEVLLGKIERPEAQHQSLRLRLLLVRGEVHWLHSELTQAWQMAELAMQGFTQLGDAQGCADAYWLRAWIAVDLGQFAPISADLHAMALCSPDPIRGALAKVAYVRLAVFFDAFSEKLDVDEHLFANSVEHNAAIRCWIEDCWGIISMESGDYVQAVRCLSKCYLLALSTKQVRRAIIAATNVADAFSCLNDYQSAMEWHQRALDLAEKTNWASMKGMVLRDTGETHLHLQHFELAHSMLQEALQLLQAVAGSHNFAIALGYIGEVELARQQYANALQTFQLLEPRAKALQQSHLLYFAYRGQARALLELAQPSAAMQIAKRALGEMHTVSAKPDLQIALLEILAEIEHRYPPVNVAQAAQAANVEQAANNALVYMQQALKLASTIDNYIVPAKLLEAIARQFASLGDYQLAYANEIAASKSREQNHRREAANRAKAMQLSHENERAQVEEAHGRELAAEAKRAEILHQTSSILEHLGAIGQEITAHLEFDQVFAVLNRHLRHLFSLNVFAVALFDDAQQSGQLVYVCEDDKPVTTSLLNWQIANSKISQVMLQKRDVIFNCDPSIPDPDWPSGIRPTSSRLFTPLCLAERVLGLMTVQSYRQHAYGPRDQMVLRTLSAYAAIAMSNAQTHSKLTSAHRQLQETQQQMVLQGKMAGLGTLTAGVAHEINNPTNFVHVAAQNQSVDVDDFELYVDNLLEADDAAEVALGFKQRFTKLRANLNTVLTGTERIKGIVKDLRSFTRLDQAEKKSVRLSECLHSTLNLVRASWLEKVEFQCEIIDDPWYECWPALLNQVLMNLLVNGCQAIEERRQREPSFEHGKLCLSLRQQADALILECTDNGIGIASSEWNKVMQPFYSTRAAGSGTGLGLSIALGIIEKHGGCLRFTSQYGQGSSFALRLPLLDQASAPCCKK